MRKYLIGLFLILLVVGCQQQATTSTESPPTGQVITPAETEEVPTEIEVPAETEAEEPTETVKEALAGGDVSILGKEGFDPAEITVKEGSTVVFTNNDPKGKSLVLTFQIGRKFIASGKIEAGKKYEQVFDEKGTYDYWTITYGVKGKVVVE